MEAERSVLGAVLLNNAAYDEAAELLVEDDFSLSAHRCIWRSMVELRESNRPVDMILLTELLDQHREIGKIGGVSYLSSLIDGVPERASIAHYCKIVRDKAMLRGIINAARTAIEEAVSHPEEAEEVLARAELAISQLSETVIERKWSTFRDSIDAAGSLDNYMRRMTDPVVMNGLPTKYRELDAVLGGLPKKTLIIVAARPSVGKTAFCLNVVQNVLDDPELVVAVFSLEMSKEALERRLLASAGRVSVRKATSSGFLSLDEQGRLTEALGEILGKRLFIDDSSYLTPIRLRSKCRQLKRKEGRLDLAVIDYLQLMNGGAKFENRTQEVSAISRSLKALAKDLDCPVVALSQLSRNVEGRSDKTPILSDLRESGSLEQDADVVIFIHRPEMYSNDADLQGLAEVNVAKNRDGATGRLQLAWIADYTRFENLARVL
jgi:replicative DNA helicase